MVNILTGTPFDPPKRLNHRDDEGALEFPSSVGSRARGLLALKACNWRAASGGGWKNPYITDGLVAMWDGEWNVGGGVHSDTLTSWNDICIGRTAEIRGTPTVNDKFLGLGINAHCFCSDVSGLPTQDGAIEIVYRLRTTTDGLILSSSELKFGIGPYRKTTVIGANSYYRPVVSAKVVGQIQTISAMQYPSTICYINGNTATIGGNDSYTATNGLTFPGRYIVQKIRDNIDTDIFCIRIYSRVLTAAEIAANYAVDQARFGLA